MSTFRAFQTGLAAGQEQRKYRDETDARTQAAEAFKSGNFEGAVAPLMRVGLMQEADAYGQAGQRKQEAERAQTYMQAYKTGLGAGPAPNKRGAYEALGNAAMEQGDFGTMQQVEQAIAGMDEQQKAALAESMEFLGQTALNLKGVPPEARGQAAMEILQNSPMANPQIMQQIQQAAADGKITDEELDNFAMQTMSVAERVKLNQPKAPSYSTVTTRDGIMAYNTADPTQTVPLGKAPLPASAQGSQEGYRPATPQELVAWGIPEGTPVKINIRTGEPQVISGAKPSSEYTPAQQSKFIQQAQTLDAVEGAINAYIQLIESNNPQMWTTGLGGDNPVAKELDAARTAILIQAKELFNLGVLNGPDLEIISSAVPGVTGFDALGKSAASVKQQLSVLSDYIERGRNQIPPELLRKARPQQAAAAPQQQPVDIDALLDDVTSAIPGGYDAWREREGLTQPSASDLGDDELRAMLGLD